MSVSDGKSTSEINVEIEIIDQNQPPVFNQINCTRAILEDTEYNCEINATDYENNAFNLSILSENKLHCNFQNKT